MTTFGLELQDRQRRLFTAIYPLFAILAINPVLTLIVMNSGADFSNVVRRFAFAGMLISEAMPTHATGLALLLMLATWLGHRNVARGVAVVAVISAVAIIGFVLIFGLDALQVRRTVPQAQKPQFDASGLKTLLMSILLVPSLLWLAFRTFSATRGTTSRSVTSDAGLVVGRQ